MDDLQKLFKSKFKQQALDGDSKYAKMNLEDANPENLPPPVQSTEARRFSVSGHHVSWLGWQFDFQFSAIAAAQFFNIKFNDER